MLYKLYLSFAHPAVLLSFGNTLLAFSHAELFGIVLSVAIAIAVLATRTYEVFTTRVLGVPYAILAVANLCTGISILVNIFIIGGTGGWGAYIAAGSFFSWFVGEAWAGYDEYNKTRQKTVASNPQFYFGIGDFLAVQVSGLNPYAGAVMALGFVRSIFTNHSAQDSSWYGEVTAARLYGVAYLIGAVVSIHNPIYAVAQIFWGLGYLYFPKDT